MAQTQQFLQGNTMLPVNEIFDTIQGEAFYTGSPAIFVRLQGCPIGCPWCDTKHTWDVQAENKIPPKTMLIKQEDTPNFAYMTAQEITDYCVQLPTKLVVITGGEPAMYDLTKLTELLGNAGKDVQLETSGTFPLKVSYRHTWVTVSPKLNMPGGYKINQETLLRANEIKFPVGKEQDVENLKALLKDNNLHKLVWLQPLSQSKKATDLCMTAARDNGWRVSIQTHKFLGVR
jgi:7-carboxy-7-deazaguanine synthase